MELCVICGELKTITIMNKIIELLGNQAEYYLTTLAKPIDKSLIHVPSPDTIDKIWIDSDRNIRLCAVAEHCWGMVVWQTPDMYPFFRSIDIEHTGGASFAPNPFISTRKTL